MLPSRGRGRGRGRGRNPEREIGQEPGRPQPLPNPPEQKIPGTQSQRPHRGRGFRRNPQPGTSRDEKTPETYTHREDFSSGTQDKGIKPSELSLELDIQFKRKLKMAPSKPNEGDLGKRIKLISNCFPLKMPSGNVYHYDVSITQKRRNPEPEDKSSALLPAGDHKDDKKYRCLNTKRNREIITLMLNNNPLFHDLYAAYDGQKNLYTRNSLLASFPVKCEVILPDENAEDPDNEPDENTANRRQNAFEVKIKPVTKKETDSCAISLDSLHALYEKRTDSVPQETITALETILRHGPCLRFTPIGRSFFYPPGPQNLHPLGGGLEIWFGYHQSLRLGQWGPMVNLDVAATAFHQKGPVLQYIANLLNKRVGDLRRMHLLPSTDIKRISNKLKNMRIEVNHVRNYRRKYRIFKLVKENANHLEFDLTENGRTVTKTVAAYFRERYDRNLEFAHLPCLQVYPENKKRYLPLEVCDILEGQHSKRKLENRQTAEMIKFTAQSPIDRFAEIRRTANRVDINSDTFVREFGIEISRNPLSLEGRVLDPPTVIYKDGEIKPKDGSWDMRHSQFLLGAEIDSWVLLSFAEVDFRDLNRFSELLLKISKSMGISINTPKLVDVVDVSRCDIKSVLSKIKIVHKADLAVIVIPSNDKLLYGKIKQAAETAVGLATQCIKENNITNPRRCNPQLISNLCQKINAKMGGANNALVRSEIPSIMWKPVIIVGADVSHGGPSRSTKPSLAACVGSLDSRFSRYAVSIRAQANVDANKQSVEIIADLENMILELLRAFYRHTHGMKPEKIIFYRDGVSEGQFDTVQNKEIVCIRKACRTLGADYQPGLTFIVVQKRHHVRFMPEDKRDGIGNMKNIPPGTTVDTVVTHPENFDYFLCSHFGIKGTSRPAHYTVLEDDNGFTSNDIQKLTYQLCHIYSRCTRSISIPVPVAYAHLAANRARQHLEASIEESTSCSDSSAEDDFQALSQAVKDAIKVIPDLQNAMYFV